MKSNEYFNPFLEINDLKELFSSRSEEIRRIAIVALRSAIRSERIKRHDLMKLLSDTDLTVPELEMILDVLITVEKYRVDAYELSQSLTDKKL